MVQIFSELATNIDQLLASVTVLFPAFFAYFVYVGLRTPDFNELKRSHIVLVLFFALFFQIFRDLTQGIPLISHGFAFFFVLPPLLGVVSDISHRVFATRIAEAYQTRVIEKSDTLALKDVGSVSRWQKTIPRFVADSVYTNYYVEVELESVDHEINPKRGFLNGYSEDDIELIRYDDLSEKEFPGIGSPDVNPEELTSTVEIIPRNKIHSVRIYRIKMEDFELE